MTARSPLDPLRPYLPVDAALRRMGKHELIEMLVDFCTQLATIKEKCAEKKTPWVVIDAEKQELRCDKCSGTHPLEDGVNHRPVWFACAVMNGFTKEHEGCGP